MLSPTGSTKVCRPFVQPMRDNFHQPLEGVDNLIRLGVCDNGLLTLSKSIETGWSGKGSRAHGSGFGKNTDLGWLWGEGVW